MLEVIQFDKASENLLLFFFGDSTSRIPNEEPDFIFFRRVIAEMDVSGRSVFDCVGYIIVDDYDPSATKVNQENRIKLMLSVAKERLNQKNNSTEV